MILFSEFSKTTNSNSDVCITSTNYNNFAGMWTIGLKSEATHKGSRLFNTPNSRTWNKSRGRYNCPSRKCLIEMIEYAKYLTKFNNEIKDNIKEK